ncbi:MAG: hypothetical protein R3A51_11660 [Nannocystaceae bacterium]
MLVLGALLHWRIPGNGDGDLDVERAYWSPRLILEDERYSQRILLFTEERDGVYHYDDRDDLLQFEDVE